MYESLHKLEEVYGHIPYKFGMGQVSKAIIEKIETNNPSNTEETGIDGLIMFDRDLDKISPFCISKNFEGFLDEFFGIQMCSINIDKKIICPDEAKRDEIKEFLGPGDSKEILLNSGYYRFYNEIRYLHFNAAGGKLNA